MKIIDLTHVVSPDMPMYPGTEPPQIATECIIDRDGFLEKRVSLSSHTGTHIDAPAHIVKGRATLDKIAVERFHGSAVMLDATGFRNKIIDIRTLETCKERVQTVDFIIFHTGWSRYWGMEEYFSGYPVLSEAAADWLGNFQLKGIGFDAISADEDESRDFPIHNTLLGQEIIIVENLTNLSALPETPFEFSCFPLKIEEADGSPVRAVAYIR